MKKIYIWFLVFLVVMLALFFYKQAHAPTSDNLLIQEIENINQDINENTLMSLALTSPAFVDGQNIPSKYTCDGENINPELHISGIPEGTVSLVLVMDDPDIPDSVKESRGIEKFDHWVIYNMPPDTTVIKEGEKVGNEGLSSRGETGYVGSCPPDREHRYFFRLYALPNTLNFIKTPTLDEVETVAKESAIESTILMGRYQRTDR
ncbi:MAG: YbhB/YbcL family Raf kinase inhibitor-like protein [Candidatus Paceibacterota bacterium]